MPPLHTATPHRPARHDSAPEPEALTASPPTPFSSPGPEGMEGMDRLPEGVETAPVGAPREIAAGPGPAAAPPVEEDLSRKWDEKVRGHVEVEEDLSRKRDEEVRGHVEETAPEHHAQEWEGTGRERLEETAAEDLSLEWEEDVRRHLGEPDPEDELPLVGHDLSERGSSGPPPGSRPHRTHDAGHVEDVAARLERIARALRERGPAGALAEQGSDALGALITGYLLGFSDSESQRDPPA